MGKGFSVMAGLFFTVALAVIARPSAGGGLSGLQLRSEYQAIQQLIRDGRLPEAVRRCERLSAKLDRDHAFGPDSGVTLLVRNLTAELLIRLDDYGAAEAILEEIVPIAKASEDVKWADYTIYVLNLGKVRELSGDLIGADRQYQMAVEIARREGLPYHEALALNNLGWLRHIQSRENPSLLVEAERVLSQAYKLRSQPGTYAGKPAALRAEQLAESLHNLGTVRFSAGTKRNGFDRMRLEEAEQAYRQSMEQLKRVAPQHPRLIVMNNNLARLYRVMRPAKAAAAAQTAIELALHHRGEAHPDTAVVRNTLAWIHLTNKNANDATRQFHLAQQALRSHAFRVLAGQTVNQQVQFLRNKYRRWFHGALTFGWLNRNKGNQAAVNRSAEWLLNGKGLIYDVLSERYRLQLSKDPANKELRRQLAELRQLRSELAALEARALAGDAKGRDELMSRVDAIAAKVARQLAKNQNFYRWVKLDEVRRRIPPNSVLVEVARFQPADFGAPRSEWEFGPSRYAVWLIPPAGKGDVKVIDLGAAKEIDASINAFRRVLFGDRQKVADALDRVTQRLLPPALFREIRFYRRWLISPDGEAWFVPWQALRVDGRYAVEDHDVAYLVSGRHLMNNTSTDSARRAFLLGNIDYGKGKFFPPLPYSLAEVNGIKAVLDKLSPESIEVIAGRSATKRRFLSLTGGRTFVLSTHAFFRPRANDKGDPFLRCGIALAQANEQAGDANILYASEVLGMDFRGTRLVMLSACETGLGKIRGGEGPASLAYAFQLAGAENVVASLWEVPDDITATLSVGFFRNLVQNGKLTMDQALCQAQRNHLRDFRGEPQENPSYWAPMCLIGPPRPLR